MRRRKVRRETRPAIETSDLQPSGPPDGVTLNCEEGQSYRSETLACQAKKHAIANIFLPSLGTNYSLAFLSSHRMSFVAPARTNAMHLSRNELQRITPALALFASRALV